MPDKEELETTNIIALAVLCQKVADTPSIDKETATKAGNMKWEWAKLVSREPALNSKEKKKIEEQTAALKKRMIELLTTV